MSGAYEPAIHAYLRSIQLNKTFGRSYSNLAMAYVQTGKYSEAIKIYHRSIDLLVDKKEKATTWIRLGILYRQIKDYENALEAYQRADLILPHQDASVETPTKVELPLTVSLPDVNLDAILAKGNITKLQIQTSAMLDINAEFEIAENEQEELIIEELMNSLESEKNSQADDMTFQPPVYMECEWKPEYGEENVLIESLANDAQIDIQESSLEFEDTSEASNDIEQIDTQSSDTFIESNNSSEAVDISMIDLSPQERYALEAEIIKFQNETSKNPRSYILWEGLGEAYKSAGRYKDAIMAFQKAITMNPTNAMCHYRLGLVFAAERKVQEAISSFRKVLELDPSSAQAHASLASQYRKIGSTQAAEEHIEKARAMQLDEESDYNHACLEALCGNNQRALDLLEVALQTKQTYVTWAKNDPDLDSLRHDERFQMLLSAHTAVAA